MKLLFVFITLFSCCIISCDKEEIRKSFVDGVLVTAQTHEPIPYAKIYLMMTDDIFFTTSGTLDAWYPVDSSVTDDNGAFHFDFEIDEDVVRIGVYPQKEHYFDYRRVIHYSSTEMEAGIQPDLSPKSYLKIRVKDEPPFSDYTGIRIPTVPSQELILLEGNPIDTTVYMWLHGGESLLMGWYYRNTDTTWVSESGGWVGCPSFDTCSYEILF
jgi:hypothetical protein